ncbi:MAG TPA: aminotransferase class V-fold PLP-dependent enzyme [Pyrinomonadaceae bacterium]|jgi:glutamate decarboxylase|nr:aminotransferase class V-fold PLP-dependent enzyme [Pyrinomonadaceae bacterium]
MNRVPSAHTASSLKDYVEGLFVSSTDEGDHLATLRERLRTCLTTLREAGVIHLGSWTGGHEARQSALPAGPLSTDEYFEKLLENVALRSVDISSPLCMGHMSGIVPQFTAVLSEFIVTLNQNLIKREASRALTLIERQTLGMMHRLVYSRSEEFYEQHIQNTESTLGLMTAGGTLGNLTALWLARNACFPRTEQFEGVEVAGLPAALERHGYAGAVILGSRLLHYSIQKAAGILGLGSQSVMRLRLDSANRVEIKALRESLAECRRRRQRVIAIVGVAGSTDCGSLDPLDEMGRIARDAGIFFHVDAAWGGPLLFSARHRARLAGIAEADSVVIDGHKQMYLPVGTGMLLLREPSTAKLIEMNSHYVIQNGSGDLGQRSLEGSRDGAALFLHAALHLIGAEGYGFLMEENLRKAQLLASMLKERAEFELLFEPETNIVLYRYLPAPFRAPLQRQRDFSAAENARLNSFNEMLQKRQSDAGRTFVARTTIEEHGQGESHPVVALRAVVSNPLIEEKHLRVVLQDQAAIGAELECLAEW